MNPKKLLTLLCAAALAAAPAAAQSLREGADYLLVSPPQPERVAKGKIEVIEFFNFSCPHCFRLQKPFKEWKEKLTPADNVAIVYQPVVFARYRGHYARIYYTLDALGIAAEFVPKVYRAIHQDKTLINSKGRFLDWLAENGVKRNKAEAVYDSFTVINRTERANRVAVEYGVNSTPNIAVGGKYLLNAGLSGSYERMLETLTALVKQENAEREESAQEQES